MVHALKNVYIFFFNGSYSALREERNQKLMPCFLLDIFKEVGWVCRTNNIFSLFYFFSIYLLLLLLYFLYFFANFLKKYIFIPVKFVLVIDIENNDYQVGFDKIALNCDKRVSRKNQVFPAVFIFWEN